MAEIKIDRSFVSRVAVVDDDATVVRALTLLAHGLGLQVVAEGVETAATWSTIADIGCDSAQGWFVARPMTGVQVTEWLAQRHQPAILSAPHERTAREELAGAREAVTADGAVAVHP